MADRRRPSTPPPGPEGVARAGVRYTLLMPTVPAIAQVAEGLCHTLGYPDYVPLPSVGQRHAILAKIMASWAADSFALDALEVLHSHGLVACENPTRHNLFSHYNLTMWECSDISAQADTSPKP